MPTLLKDGLQCKIRSLTSRFRPVADTLAYDGLDNLIAIARQDWVNGGFGVFNDASFTREADSEWRFSMGESWLSIPPLGPAQATPR